MRDPLNYNWQINHFNCVKNVIHFQRGLFIWVFNWTNIPHLGLSIHGLYCDVTIHGNHVDEPVDKYFRMVNRKNIPTFCIQLNVQELSKDYHNIFSRTLDKNETCLSPIKEALGFEQDQLETLSDLINILNKEGKISSFISLQETDLLFLKSYSKEDVLSLIEKKINYAIGK